MYLKVAKTSGSQITRKGYLQWQDGGVSNAIMTIFPLYTNTPNQHVATLNLCNVTCQLLLNKAGCGEGAGSFWFDALGSSGITSLVPLTKTHTLCLRKETPDKCELSSIARNNRLPKTPPSWKTGKRLRSWPRETRLKRHGDKQTQRTVLDEGGELSVQRHRETIHGIQTAEQVTLQHKR